MAEDSTVPAAAPATPKKGRKSAAGKPKKPKTTSSHPKVSVMVPAAIGALKERGGSSLQAIKKYVSSTYKVDADRLAPFIKKYLKSAVESGALLQTKGKGASGSFKLKGSAPKTPDARPAKPKKAAAPRARKPAAAKKTPAKAKRAPAEKKKKAPKPNRSPKRSSAAAAAAAAAAAKPAKSPKKAKSPAKKASKPKAAKKAKSPAKKASKK